MDRSFTMAWRVLAALTLALPVLVGAQQKTLFGALSDEMQGKILPFEKGVS